MPELGFKPRQADSYRTPLPLAVVVGSGKHGSVRAQVEVLGRSFWPQLQNRLQWGRLSTHKMERLEAGRSSPGLSQRPSRWEQRVSVLRRDACTPKAQLLLISLWDTHEDHVSVLGCYLMMIPTRKQFI